MLVVGSLFQVAACLVQFLQLSFPLFVLSFGLGGIGMSFQVRIIYTHEELVGIATDNALLISRMHLQMASLRLFKMTLVTKWALCTLHMVQLSHNTPTQQTNTIYNS